MTKKPIMIDDVDVSGCPFYEYQTEEDLQMRYPNSGDCEIGLAGYLFDFSPIQEQLEKHCIDNPNCYYKQHKRKEQECEELKIKNKEQKRQLRVRASILNTHKQALQEIFKCLIMANRADKLTTNTLWIDNSTTLWDYFALTLGLEGDQLEIEEQILQKCEVIDEK